MPNLKLIEAKTLGSNTPSITFTSIPQTYTDLKLVYSARNTATSAGEGYDATISFNGTTANRVTRVLRGDGSSVAVNTISDPTDFRLLRSIQPSDYTSSTFSNVEIYLPNYTSSNYKLFSVDTVLENNATATGLGIIAGQWSDTAEITSITLGGTGGNLLSGSTFYLYGISNVTTGSKATGGIVSYDTNYYYHMFPYSGTFTPTENITADYLVIAGGGAGGRGNSDEGGGGGGAGGLRSTVTATGGAGSLETAVSLTSATAYTITVGAGGTGVAGGVSGAGNNGSNSSIAGSGLTTITSTGGGGGNGATNVSQSGGSGGGGGSATNAPTAGTGTQYQGYAGGDGIASPQRAAGGGGGAGAVGTAGNTSIGGAGGNGVQITVFANATQTGANNGYYAGGGGGGTGYGLPAGAGGLGGGGAGSAISGGSVGIGTAGTVNTGGGGGASTGPAATSPGAAGGSGLVIIRYAI